MGENGKRFSGNSLRGFTEPTRLRQSWFGPDGDKPRKNSKTRSLSQVDVAKFKTRSVHKDTSHKDGTPHKDGEEETGDKKPAPPPPMIRQNSQEWEISPKPRDSETNGASLDELPLLVTLLSGERLRVLVNANDKFEDIQKTVWKKASLTDDPSSYCFRLKNAEVVFSDQATGRDLWQNWLLYREIGFSETLEVGLLDKRDIGDALKKQSKMVTPNGLVRAMGYLKKRSSAGVQKWHNRFFVLQDYSLFYFSTQEDYEKKLPASDVIPMGSCKVEIVSDSTVAVPRHGRSTSVGRRRSLVNMPEEYTFRLAADVVGKREFLLRTKQADDLQTWVTAINAINLSRVKRIVFDSTKELMERIDDEDLLSATKVIHDESPEAEKLLRVYAYGMYPKLEYATDSVLFELLASSLKTLTPPLLPDAFLDVVKKGMEAHEIKALFTQIPLALRALLEHLIIFGHFISSYSEINGLTRHSISALLASVLLPAESEGPKIMLHIIERRMKLWPESVEAQLAELRHLFFVEAPIMRRRQSKGDTLSASPKVESISLSTGKLSRIPILGSTAPSPIPGISAAQAALLAGLSAPPPPKPVKKTVLPSQVRFPLIFLLAQPTGESVEVKVRVVEELKSVEGRPYTPGRFYSFEDLKRKQLGNQEGTPEGLIPAYASLAHEYLDEDKHLSPYIPEVVCLVFLGQRGNLAALSQIANYLKNSAPPPKRDSTSSSRPPSAMEPMYIERTRRSILRNLEGEGSRTSTPEGGRRKRRSAKRTLLPSFDSDEDDEFVDIDTVAPPSETKGHFAETRGNNIKDTGNGGGSIISVSGGSIIHTNGGGSIINTSGGGGSIISTSGGSIISTHTINPLLLSRKETGKNMRGSGGKEAGAAAGSSSHTTRGKIASCLHGRRSGSLPRQTGRKSSVSAGVASSSTTTTAATATHSNNSSVISTSFSNAEEKRVFGGSSPSLPHSSLSSRQSNVLENFCTIHHAETQVFCRECKENFCQECDDYVHLIGTKRSHTRTKFTPSNSSVSPLGHSPRISIIDRPQQAMDRSTSHASLVVDEEHAPPGSISKTSTRSRTHSEESTQVEKVLKPITFDQSSSFEHVMRYSESRNCFRKFLASEYSEENILFWDEVNKFLEEDVETQFKLAKYIFETFFGPKAAKQINVRGMNAQVKEALSTNDPAEAVQQCTFLFLEAQASVVALLKWDSFPRFKQSPLFDQFREQFQKRDLVRMKVVKEKKLHKNVMRVLQFDSHMMTLTFFKPDNDGEFGKVEITIPAVNLVNVQLSVKRPKKLKITFFKDNQRLLRNQKEWRLVFRTVSERERLARLITTNLLLCRNAAPARYEPQPLTLDKKTLERTRELPVTEIAADVHDSFIAEQLRDGWVLGEVFSEDHKTDPALIPFHRLTGTAREFSLGIAGIIVGSIIELGYSISLSYDDMVLDLDEDSQLLLLVEFLAENVHDCWAFAKMKLGWLYGENRSEAEKTHPNLVPYIDLYEADMDRNRQAAITVLRSLLDRGYKIQPDT